jgi:hypothetical protein
MTINNSVINVVKVSGEDYICLTDMAKSVGSERALHSWLRAKNTIDFLGFWEQMYNPHFNLHEFVYFKNQAGANSFNPSIVEWITTTNAKGIIAKRGRYGGTYAHKDIAFEFGTWLSPEFKLLVITEFQRLKEREEHLIKWDSHRYLSRINYRLHTDSIKNELLPLLNLEKSKQSFVYTDEADMLNMIIFGQTAAEWRNTNPDLTKSGRNQRDYATIEQLVLLANAENLNAHFISEGKNQSERITLLIKAIKRQYETFVKHEHEHEIEDNKMTFESTQKQQNAY